MIHVESEEVESEMFHFRAQCSCLTRLTVSEISSNCVVMGHVKKVCGLSLKVCYSEEEKCKFVSQCV